jgi:hypothetical protein
MTTVWHTADYIPIMVERIVKAFNPVKIILFGSHARGDARPDSDIDLLVVMPDDLADPVETWHGMMRAVSGLPAAKDIIITTPGEIARRGNLVGTVLRPALRQGKTLYER